MREHLKAAAATIAALVWVWASFATDGIVAGVTLLLLAVGAFYGVMLEAFQRDANQ